MSKYVYLLLLFAVSVVSQESPCPNLFRYEYNGNQWYGIIRLLTRNFGKTINLSLSMSIGALLPPNFSPSIRLVESDDVVYQSISRGGIITYKVMFPFLNLIPRVSSLVVNGREYCPGRPVSAQITSNFIVNHSISTSGNSNINSVLYPTTEIPTTSISIDDRIPVIPPKTTTTTTTTPRPTTVLPKSTRKPQNPIQNNNNKTSEECGKVRPNPLLTRGDKTQKGDWPWLAALYHNDHNGLSFKCSGSLISKKHIVTAAHCIAVGNGKKNITVILGAYNLQSYTDPDQKFVQVTKSIVHPQYDKINKFNDIAVLKIKSVKYTQFIQPVCLWTSDISLDSIVGRKGTVIGWGKDEFNNIVVPEPLKTEVTIVSTDDCRSEFPYLTDYTTDKTLCAGNKDLSGPCNGDSGGGLYIVNNRRWSLRGIVSNSQRGQNGEECVNDDYAVYTDSAKYIDWIRSVTS